MFNSRFGRKLLWQILPKNVHAITSGFSDHRLTYNPHELIGRRLIIKGDFGRAETVLTLDHAENLGILSEARRVIIEIGANIGTQSVYFALDPRVDHIIAIEPEPTNLNFLRQNIADNKLSDIIDVAPYGAAAVEGYMDLFLSPSNSGASSFYKVKDGSQTVRVPTKPVSIILSERGISPENIALIWMDIEGYEPDIFESIVPILSHGMLLYMEFSPQFYGSAKTKRFVKDLARVFKTAEVLQGRKWKSVPIGDLSNINRQINIMLRYGN